MKNIFKISTVLFIGVSLVVSSCKEDEVLIEGCTDSSAMNYQSLANSNDGSCWFSHEAMVNTWNISPVCDGDLVGGVLPSTIEVSAGDNLGDLMIDLGTTGAFKGLTFDLNCSFTNRFQDSNVYLEEYSWRMTERPTALSSVITYTT